MPEGTYVHLELAEIEAMLAEKIAVSTAISKGQQSRSVLGMSYTRQQADDVRKDIAELSFAKAMKSGGLVRRTYAGLDL